MKTAAKEVASVRVKADGTPTVVRNLAKWLRECLYLIAEDDATARFTRVVCRQLVKGNKRGEEVFFLDVPKKAGEDWPDNASTEIYGKLQTETATLGGLQKYALYSYHTGDTENHTSRFVLRIQGIDDEDDEDGLNSEGPDKQGLTSQAMRHTEASNKTMAAMVATLVTGFQTMISRQGQMLERQSSMVEKLMEDQIASIDAIRELTNEKDERDIRLTQARAKAKGIENMIGKLGVLLPAVANKVAGQPIFPVQDASVTMMTRALFTSMVQDEERMKKIMPLLTTEETIAFTNILETVSGKFDENGLPVNKPKEDDKG